jgi:hypothetical protein
MRRFWIAFAAVAVVLGLACGSETIVTVETCTPGQSAACSQSGCSGMHACKADGSGYDACVCFADGGAGRPEGGADAGTQPDSAPDSPSDGPSDVSKSDDSSSADSGSPDTTAHDSGSPDSSSADCRSWALGGIGVPTGTVATASTTYSTDVPALAIDGNLATLWNATNYSGWLSLEFPTPLSITGIRMAASSSPATEETYSVTTLSGSTVIGGATEMVNGNTSIDGGPPYTIEPAIPITPGTYDGIIINVSESSSWIVINEVSLLTAACP